MTAKKPAYEALTARIEALEKELQQRIQCESDLRDLGLQYKLIFDKARDAIFVIQNDVVQFANRRARTVLGYSDQELSATAVAAPTADAGKAKGALLVGAFVTSLAGVNTIPIGISFFSGALMLIVALMVLMVVLNFSNVIGLLGSGGLLSSLNNCTHRCFWQWIWFILAYRTVPQDQFDCFVSHHISP